MRTARQGNEYKALKKRVKLYLLREDCPNLGELVRAKLYLFIRKKRSCSRIHPLESERLGFFGRWAIKYHNNRKGKPLTEKVILLTEELYDVLYRMREIFSENMPGITFGDICGSLKRNPKTVKLLEPIFVRRTQTSLTEKALKHLALLKDRLESQLKRKVSRSEIIRIALLNFWRKATDKRASRVAAISAHYKILPKKKICITASGVGCDGEITREMIVKRLEYLRLGIRKPCWFWEGLPKRITNGLIIESAILSYHAFRV